ncbi:ras-related protein RabC-like isoform X1 [Tigriopus californicus]|uniref:ras-related protein RabC-like isoform X1 n=1 Tax=Tigriopus californicus TaxID=6832 RepID=UPI0027DA789C|nr:ras-related protein RabC-like isoform X1 [Tigriopus californicus]
MATVKIPAQKVILVGEYGVGKSSLFRRFANDTFVRASDRQSTLGLDNFGKVYQMKDTDRALKLQLWDTGGMERVASITSSYYKYSEAAILVFALDRPDSFHVLSQHLLDIVTYAENAKIFLCGNKFDLKSRIQVTDGEMEAFSEQCHNLMSGLYKTSCKTGEGVEEMFRDIANQLSETNRSKIELQSLEEARSFRIDQALEADENGPNDCSC